MPLAGGAISANRLPITLGIIKMIGGVATAVDHRPCLLHDDFTIAENGFRASAGLAARKPVSLAAFPEP